MTKIHNSPVRLCLSEVIREFIIERKLRNLSPQTITWYEKRLGIVQRELADPILSEISLSSVRSMIGRMLDQELTPGTINGNLQAIKALLAWAFEEELEIGLDPRRIKLIKRPRTMPQILNKEQIEQMLRLLKSETFSGRRDRMIILTFIDTGCRLSELCNMDVEHFCVPFLRVRGKGDKERTLALSLPAQREMLRWLRTRRTMFNRDEGPLFPSRNYPNRLGRNRIGLIVRRLAAAAGIPFAVTPHTFRRTFASHFLRQRGSLVHLQQILGHSDITMSRRYAAVYDEDAHKSSMDLSILNELRLRR